MQSQQDKTNLDLLDDIHALNHLAEHHVLAIQPLGLGGAHEELGAVGVGSSIGHGEDSRPGVLQLKQMLINRIALISLKMCIFTWKFSSSNLLP